MKRLIPLLMLACLVCSACQSSGLSPTASPALRLPTYFPTIVEATPQSSTPRTQKATPMGTLVPPTLTFILSPTPSSYEPYTIDALRSRAYGNGNIEVPEAMEETDSFTRYLIRYPSDGLNIYGFANIPKGDGPFPVIIVVHGFVNPAKYQTLDYTTPAVDQLTQAGYIVIHPNLRGYPPSDNDDNLFRVGMAIDVLNLIALIKSETGHSALLAKAAPDRIGLWGHSLGGDVILRALTVSPDIKAAVLYASISGDELKNAQLFANSSPDTSRIELNAPPAIVKRISPIYYYGDITAPVQLYHGTADQTVPVAWAEETCDALTAAGVRTECIYYPEEDHTFRRRVADQFWNAMLGFYERYLSP
jgi:dipeptidyl aminopeptidase/acylaminoacyl peptidase